MLCFPVNSALAARAGLPPCPLGSHSMYGNTFHVGLQSLLLLATLLNVKLADPAAAGAPAVPAAVGAPEDTIAEPLPSDKVSKLDMGKLPKQISCVLRQRAFRVKLAEWHDAEFFDWATYGSWQKALDAAKAWLASAESKKDELTNMSVKDLRELARVGGLRAPVRRGF